MQKDLVKPQDERYIHSIITTETGGIVVFTANSFLLSLIHKAATIQVDTTFKCAVGDLKEWEVVIWEPEVQHGAWTSLTDQGIQVQLSYFF